MRDIMRFPSIRPLPHRLVTTLAVVSITGFTLAAGALRAAEEATPAPEQAYTLRLSVTPPDGQQVLIDAVVLDGKGTVLMHPRVQTQRGVNASVTSDDFILDFAWSGHDLTATLHSRKDNRLFATVSYSPPTGAKSDAINLNLRDADIRDVARTFSQLTGLQIVVDDGIEAKVSIEVTDMPWQEALERCVKGAGLHMERRGERIRITN
jgi:hypothetical protein